MATIDAEKAFLERRYRDCWHDEGFTYDTSLTTVTCRKCKREINPIYAIKMLSQSESRWNRSRQEFIDTKAAMEKKSRTKCEHCMKMTRVRVSRADLKAVRDEG